MDDSGDSFQFHWWRWPGTRSRWTVKDAEWQSWGSPGTSTGFSTCQAASHHHHIALSTLCEREVNREEFLWKKRCFGVYSVWPALTCDRAVVAVSRNPTESYASFIWIWQLQVSWRIWTVYTHTHKKKKTCTVKKPNALYGWWNVIYFKHVIPITIRRAEADFCSSSLLTTHV